MALAATDWCTNWKWKQSVISTRPKLQIMQVEGVSNYIIHTLILYLPHSIPCQLENTTSLISDYPLKVWLHHGQIRGYILIIVSKITALSLLSACENILLVLNGWSVNLSF